MKNKPTCSPWLHARLGEQLGLSPRSSGRVGGLSAGAQRTRRSSKGARLPGRGSRKPSSAAGCRRESSVAQIYPCHDWQYSVLEPRGRGQWRLGLSYAGRTTGRTVSWVPCLQVYALGSDPQGAVEIKRHHYHLAVEFPFLRAYSYFCTVVFFGSCHRSRRGSELVQIRRSTPVGDRPLFISTP